MSTLNKNRYSFRHVEKKYNSPSNNTKNIDKALNYVCMFPYPSGKMHVGHLRNYTLADTIARYQKFRGNDVFAPMGFDSFGLPAEEAAKKYNTHPAKWTQSNIEEMTEDFKNCNMMFNWDKTVSTHTPEYYKLQQKIIIKFWEKGLLERKESYVNWDPVLKTVLANEQVDANGLGWRSGAKIQRKKINQWFLKVTNYAQELLDGLQDLDWPTRVLKTQKSWIGKSQGVEISFHNQKHNIKVFTTCPETVYGVTFLAMSAESKLAENYEFTDGPVDYFTNPYNNQQIPLYFAEYVLPDHGTGVVMGVPNIDKRDKNFAKNKEIKHINILDEDEKLINSQELNGMTMREAKQHMFDKLEKIQLYRLNDWCISRQRYWGTPMPFIHCDSCGVVPDHNHPGLPNINLTEDTTGNPLDNEHDWINTECPKCQGKAKRSTDTMDTFVDSSWYYLRYPAVNTDQLLVPKAIDLYIGGIEHAALHLIYTRAFYLMLRDCGLLGEKYPKHPIKKLFCQGMVLGPTYKGKDDGKLYSPDEIHIRNGKTMVEEQEIIVGPPVKISKSLRNGTDLSKEIDRHGVDVMRMFILSDTPPEKDMVWSLNSISGCYKFLQRAWKHHWAFIEKPIIGFAENDQQKSVYTIEKLFNNLTLAIEDLKMNVYVSDLRKILNILDDLNPSLTYKTNHKYFIHWLVSLYPVAPAISQHILEQLGYNLHEQKWYCGNKNFAKETKMIIQLNGSTKKVLTGVSSKEESIEIAKKTLKITEYKQVIYIKNQQIIINFVV